ncbi:ABC transporter H family member 2-like [Microplitis mediator]|uniref:ABC transporter H family member 2-like n=1 Tax=Microplitis mediator TaxID=375433 RepID=UPI0025523E6C|nr:ABC transporter H family member 2-like [Microplitis mediator]
MYHGDKLSHDYKKNKKIYKECLLMTSLKRWMTEFWNYFIKRFKRLLIDNRSSLSTKKSSVKLKSHEKLQVQLNSNISNKDIKCKTHRRHKRKKLSDKNDYEAKIINKYQETILTISHRSDSTDNYLKLCKNRSLLLSSRKSNNNLNHYYKSDSKLIDKKSDKSLNINMNKNKINSDFKISKIKSSSKSLLELKSSESHFNLEKRKYINGDTVDIKLIPGPFFDNNPRSLSQSESNVRSKRNEINNGNDNQELNNKLNEIKKINEFIRRRRPSKIPRLKQNVNQIVCKKYKLIE